MVDPSMIVVDPPPLTSDFGCGLSIPPFDNIFLSQQLSRDDGALGDNQNDMVSLEDLLDFDMDSSLEHLCLPSSDLEELLISTQFQQPDSTQFQQPDSNFLQFFSDFNQFGDHVIFEPADAEPRNYSGEGALSGDHNSNGSGVLSSLSPGMDSNHITDLNVKSPESNGSNLGISEKCDGAANGINCPSPGNCRSNVSLESNNPLPRSASSSPDSSNSSIKVGTIDKDIKLDDFPKNSKGRFSLLKRKKEGDELVTNNNVEFRISKFRKSTCDTENKIGSHDNCGLSEEEKRKARLMRNRESAQLSRHRKKHYVDELEDKVKSMNATIQDLNMKISYFMAENATLRQHIGGAVGVSPPPIGPPAPGIYPHPAMMYPWMPPYMVKPLGSQVPLVPIPRLKQQQTAQAPKVSKKVDNKNEVRKTKKVASVSFLGLLFFIMLFGGLVPMVNMRYGGVQEAFTGRDNYVGGGSYGNHHGRVLMVNETNYGGRRDLTGNSSLHCGKGVHGIGGEPSPNEFLRCNRSQPLTASLYVPRNDKLVKIDGNLIIHSVMASDKAMASHGKEDGETGLAVRGDLSPAIPSVARNGARHPPLRALGSGSAGKDATDGKIQEWFRESLGGPMLTSGMCTEVFQFDISSSLVPATSRNISEEQTQNSTQLVPQRNRRILYDHPIPLPVSSHDISRERAGINSQGNNLNVNKNTSSMVVSVLVDPRDTSDADIDGVLGTKSLSRIFVVVLIDSVKYVTYSCMLPFKASTATHLVTT